MSYPPQPGQWDPGAPPPSPHQPPPGYYPTPGWGAQQPPPPPSKNSGLKWLLVAVAILLVIAISVGVTLFFTRGGSGGDGPTSTSSSPTAIGDVASANDTGPVAIITSDPTCASWRTVQDALAAAQSDDWSQRDPSIPASEWTPVQKAQFEAVGTGMRTAADQAVGFAKQTPHRVMRELYGQFIAYGRAYADSLASYSPDDDFLSRANVSLSSAIAGVCDAVAYGNVIDARLHQCQPPIRLSLGSSRRSRTSRALCDRTYEGLRRMGLQINGVPSRSAGMGAIRHQHPCKPVDA